MLCDLGRFTGAGASLLRPKVGQRVELAATDPTFQRLDEIQFTLWEGPGPEAFDHGLPVVGDVRTDGRRWPLLTAEVGQKGLVVQSQAAVPLVYGVTTIGLLGAYRSDGDAFSDTDVQLLTAYSRAIAATVVQRSEGGEIDTARDDDETVSAATGMLMSYWGISETEAVARLRAHAFSAGVTLTELADALCRRRLPLSRLENEA